MAGGHTRQVRGRHGIPRRRHRWMWLASAGLVVCFVVVGAAATWQLSSGAGPRATTTVTATAAPSEEFHELTTTQIQQLPEARYNAVIAGLLPYAATDVPTPSWVTYTISADVPIYGEKHTTPVARFSFSNFHGRPTVIVPVRTDGPWVLVMTPARQILPSQAAAAAPAQTAGWVRARELRKVEDVSQRVVLSVSSQSLSILSRHGDVQATFSVGVGAPETPTPTNVTGYIQERYSDPNQGATTFPISLTSLHASAQDEPFVGEDGGLIGIHYFPVATGSVSHGCIRLPEDAAKAVSSLPLGTSVTILP